MKNTLSIILASHNGEYFKSKKSQFEHEILFKPMINWVCDICRNTNIAQNSVILSRDNENLKKLLPEGFVPVTQYMEALNILGQNMHKDVLLIKGDNIFADSETIMGALEYHRKNNNDLTSIFTIIDGRQINSNICWIKPQFLISPLENLTEESQFDDWFQNLSSVKCNKGVYLTENAACLCRIPDKKTLADMNEYARDKIIDKMYENGVNIPFRNGIIISPDAEIGIDTTILPNTIIKGHTVIGENCIIGEGTEICDSTIGDNNIIKNSILESCVVHDGAKIGPFTHIRPGSEIMDNVKLGNFVEIKASKIDKYTSVAHLTYLGDSDVGKFVNVGCGVVTANYDGAEKHKTVIGDSSFVGCNTNFIPPVAVGKGSVIGAGSTITSDVDEFSLAIARSKQTVIPDWALKKGKYKKGL